MSRAGQHAVIDRLRQAIREIEHRPARRAGVIATGLRAVDDVLPGGGFPCGALAEIAGGRASGKTAIALAALAALRAPQFSAYVDGAGELYPPAAASAGVDLHRLLVVRPPLAPRADRRKGSDGALAALWAAEALLGSGAFAVVAIDVPSSGAMAGADAIVRRLQAAAERGGAAGLWLASMDRRGLRIPAAVRIEAVQAHGRLAARLTARGADDAA